MGAAAAKALEEFVDGPKTQAEMRLAVAERFLLRWRPSAGAGTGIWDAEAICVNRDLLSALDDIVLLKEIEAFPMASPARSRMNSAIGVAMSRLMEEFLLLRVWDASGLVEGLTLAGLRFVPEKKLSSTASLHSLGSTRGYSTTTEELSLCTSDDFYASGGSRLDMVALFADCTFLDELDLIRRKSLPLLHEIALRVIRAGYTGELLRIFDKAPLRCFRQCNRLLSILQVDRCSLEADQISFHDAEWWTTEDMIRRWTLATKLIVKALVVMKRQLQVQICGAFERFRNEYFLAIAKQRILVLLKFADGFTITRSPENLIYVLEMYEALSNAAPDILLLFAGGEHAELVVRQVADVLAKLARALRIAIGGLIAKIRKNCSYAESTTCGVGVLLMTRYVMNRVELLASHRTALDFILANGDEQEPGGGAERVTTFCGLVTELIEGLERKLEEKSALIFAGTGGSAHLFLANNTSFVLNRAADAGVASLLGNEWVARRRSQLERHAASYAEASWGPVVACLETGKPAKSLVKFNAALKKAHDSQWYDEVPDPSLRATLRKALLEMVVPAYSTFVQKHPKLVRFYTADDLAEVLSEVFEGGAAHERNS